MTSRGFLKLVSDPTKSDSTRALVAHTKALQESWEDLGRDFLPAFPKSWPTVPKHSLLPGDHCNVITGITEMLRYIPFSFSETGRSLLHADIICVVCVPLQDWLAVLCNIITLIKCLSSTSDPTHHFASSWELPSPAGTYYFFSSIHFCELYPHSPSLINIS